MDIQELTTSSYGGWVFTCMSNFVLFLPRSIARFVSFLIIWFQLLFSKSQVHGDISDSSLSRTLLKEDPSNENVVGSWATPSLSRSAGSPTMKYGVAPDTTTTTQQQETGRIPKNTHSIFSTLVRWIPGSNSFSKGRNLTEDSDVNDDVTRGLQSPYHTVESYHLQSTPELSTYEESSTSDILSLDKPKARHSHKRSSSNTSKSKPTKDGSDTPTKHSKAASTSSVSAPKKRKSPIAYAFRFPRVYAPPRPLLPPLTNNFASFWDLLFPRKVKTSTIEPVHHIIPSHKTPKHTRSSSSISHSIASNDVINSLAPLPTSLRISTNANAIHHRRLKKKTLVLDLDETLIHSLSRTPGFSQGHMVEVKFQNQFATLYTVLKRPFCDEFLDQVSQWYNLVVFTASVQAYADPMIDWLEKDRKYFVQRYYRHHCTQTPMGYVKDLGLVDPELSNVLIIDNSPISYCHNQSNGVGIEGWINDPSDTSLMALIPFLSALRFTTDVRSILGLKSGDRAFGS